MNTQLTKADCENILKLIERAVQGQALQGVVEAIVVADLARKVMNIGKSLEAE